MAYRPRTVTTTSSPIMLVNFDKDRTNLIISNESGETMMMGVDRSIAYSGVHQGTPIYNGGGFEANFTNGTDPRLERWGIGSAGGTIVITEENAPNPQTEAMQRIADAIAALVSRIGTK